MAHFNCFALLTVVLAVATKTISHPSTSSSSEADEAFSSRLGKAAEAAAAAEDSPSRQSATRQFSVAIPELQQTQYQVANDEAGTYSFGYAYPDQMHTESRSSDGQVTGSYFYKDPNGHTNKVQYRADASGFRVMTNNIPPVGLQAVHDTPEVAEARRKHLETWQAIAQFNSKASTAQQTQQHQNQHQHQDASDDAIVAQPAVPTSPVEPEQIYVAPLDIETVPAAFRIDPQDVEQPFIASPILPVAEPLTALSSRSDDQIIDESKQAVITDDGTASSDNMQTAVFGANHPAVSDIEVDVEPIKLLAQLYAKHLKQNSDVQVPLDIQRPQGFHPSSLQPVNEGFDLFSRSEGDDRQAVEVSNPEFIDLRAFLLTNRFREALQDHLKSAASSSNQYDLSVSDEMDPSDPASSIMQQGTYVPQDLYNYYYNTLVEAGFKPVYVKDESPDDKIPLSLKLAALGFSGVDGQHTAQVPIKNALLPYPNNNNNNNNFKNNNNNNYFYSATPSSPTYYSHPYYQRMYQQYYSPYYNYMYRSNPYYSSSPYSQYLNYPFYSY